MEERSKKNNIRVLIAPTVVMEDGEVQYEFKRTALLIMNLIKKNHKVALCIGKNSGYKFIENVKLYSAPYPSPFGVPKFLGNIILNFASNREIQEKKGANSYEEYLYIQGALNKKYFEADIEALRKSIQDFKPNIIYTDTRLSAIVAANLEAVKIVTSYSSIENNSNSSKQYIKELIEVLEEFKIYNIQSIQDIFNMADLKVVQNSYKLEPIDTENTVFIEPIIQTQLNNYESYRPKIKEFMKNNNKILVDMDNSSVSIKKVLKEIKLAIENSNYEVYIKTNQISESSKEKIYVSRKIDLSEHLKNSLVFINNGEFDNFMMGFNFKVPQIIYPGNILRRKYNAKVMNDNKCGIYLKSNQFTARDIRQSIELIKESMFYKYNNHSIAKSIFSNGYGGTERLVNILESMVLNSKVIKL